MADELRDELEAEARARAVSLEAQGKLPAGFADEHYPLTGNERRELRRLRAALMLAEDYKTFCALVRGRKVPRSALNQEVLSLVEAAR